MSYKSYTERVERQRVALQAELCLANDLRRASCLPLWDVGKELVRQHPLLPQEAWTAQQQDRRAFAHFKREQLAGMVMPSLPVEADWQTQRAFVLRRVYLERQVQQAWLGQAQG